MPNSLLIAALVAVLAVWIVIRSRAPVEARPSEATNDLVNGMRALARGETGHRLRGDDLADEFNRMAEEIGRRHRDLDLAREEAVLLVRNLTQSREQHRSTLEEKVKERTADLQKAYEGLKKIDEMKDSFLSSVSHELRTPL